MAVKAAQLTGSADVKAKGGPASVHSMCIMNNGTLGAAGWIELRDATTPAGNTGTLRFRARFAADTDHIKCIEFAQPEDGAEGLYMPDGIRVYVNGVTNVEVWLTWEG